MYRLAVFLFLLHAACALSTSDLAALGMGGVLRSASPEYQSQCLLQDVLEFVAIDHKTFDVQASTSKTMTVTGTTPYEKHVPLATITCDGLQQVRRIRLRPSDYPSAEENLEKGIHKHCTPHINLEMEPMHHDRNLMAAHCNVTVVTDACCFDREYEELHQMHISYRSMLLRHAKLHTFQRHSGTMQENPANSSQLLMTFQLNQITPGENRFALVKQAYGGSGEAYGASQDESGTYIYHNGLLSVITDVTTFFMNVAAIALAGYAIKSELDRRSRETLAAINQTARDESLDTLLKDLQERLDFLETQLEKR